MDVLQNSLIRMGESSLAGIMQEFVFRKLTKGGRRQDSPFTQPIDTLSVSGPSKP
jgi:hypothetical protein